MLTAMHLAPNDALEHAPKLRVEAVRHKILQVRALRAALRGEIMSSCRRWSLSVKVLERPSNLRWIGKEDAAQLYQSAPF
jgi:hypothetical protein